MADTLSIWMGTCKKLFAQRGIFPSEKDVVVVDKVFGDWNGPKRLGVTDLQKYTDELIKKVTRRVVTVPLHPYVRHGVEILHGLGLKLAVVTTSKKETVVPAMEFHRLRELIDVFLGAEDVVKHKPNPEIIEKALVALGGKATESIIVGDSKKDVLAVRAAGVRTVIYYPDANRRFYREKDLKSLNPDFFITDFREILRIVSSSNHSND